ncbi:hypothetical protein [Flavobacterium sp.]|uniref:hypothetical protein n=1 Tax=Flavobacterium sp. TaxID=239 RepID=UPI0037533184
MDRRKQVIDPRLKTALVDFSQESRRKANVQVRKSAKITDGTYYLNVDASGMSGIVNLVDNKTKKEVGVTNFDGNMLNRGRELSIRALRLLFTSKGTDVKNGDYQNGTSLIPELQNAELHFIQGDNKLISLPLTDLQRFNQVDFRSLITNALVKSQEEFQIQLEFPKGVSVPAATATKLNLLRIEFRLAEKKS